MIVGYIRVSTEKQHPENQQDEIQRYADMNGLHVDLWVSEVVSGKKQASGRKLGRTI
jgi:DNA invertase Pin-like site-specific DNA recombinase